MVTTNQRSVLVAWTNERPQKPVSASRSHQHQWPPCSVWPNQRPGLPRSGQWRLLSNHCTAEFTQCTERLGGRSDALLASAPNEWVKLSSTSPNIKNSIPNECNLKIFSINQPSHQQIPVKTNVFLHQKALQGLGSCSVYKALNLPNCFDN